jgi:tetratricopeptide (TPR) repeat protein
MFGGGRKYRLDSQPKEAKISFYSPSSKSYVDLGKTPLELSPAQIKEIMKQNEDFVVLKITKSGYAVESLVLDLSNRYRVQYNADLKPLEQWHNKEAEVSSIAANSLAMKIQSIYQQLVKKDLDKALQNTTNLIEQFPKAHVFYDIKGSIQYLQGKKQESMVSYKKSLSLNPDNLQAQKMLQKIKGDK